MSKNLLIVFIKNPEAGKVKTRLAAKLGDEKALAIYYKLLSNTRAVVAKCKADKAILYSNFIDTEDQWQEDNYKKALQKGQDIGERMYNALQWGKDQGYDKVGLIGADIYNITSDILDKAFLELSYYDWVFGPAKDGGYYFVGCHHPDIAMFTLEKWSHSTVLKETLILADKNNVQVGLVDELNDIDTIEDLKGTDLEKLAIN